MKKTLVLSMLVLALFSTGGVRTCLAAEPLMSAYTSYPIFMVESVKPNILILLDNSGSMNFCAYGTWPGDGGTVGDHPFTGSPYCNGLIETKICQSSDDAEERNGDGYSYYNSDDLDLGRDSSAAYPNQIIGMRFQNIAIPPGATITNAYITFETKAVYSDVQADIFLTIKGEASDDAQTFTTASYNISSRPTTTASAAWTVPPWNNAAEMHQTPDLSAVIQEIVNRAGWVKNNSLAIIITNVDDPPNSGRMASDWDHTPAKAPLLHIEFEPGDQCKSYYGYFDPNARYTYNSGVFERDAAGLWDGNWLNWLCMRRVDIARKVLAGGLATSRTGGGNTTLIGDDHSAQPGRHFKKWFDDTAGAVSPYTGNYCYGIKGGYIYVDSDNDPYNGYIERYIIKVKKDVVSEPDVFLDGNIAGILQRVADKARWGLSWFNTDDEGGQISDSVDAGSITNMITNIENKKASTSTPLAEAFYTATGYFRQVTEGRYHSGDYGINDLNDPFYWNELGNTDEECFVDCNKSFVLLITDGESTHDISGIPAYLQDYDNDGNDPGNYPYPSNPSNPGSDYLDDIALWAHTTDLRPNEPHLPGKQVLTLYNVFAFGSGSQLLKDAARNGAFEDRNGNDIPDLDVEWDENGDGIPDAYFEAEDPGKLEAMLLKAITDILKRAASGTAVSVLATSSEGEGNLVQAYFRPLVIEGVEQIKWIGNLQSLWVDTQGNMREDTNLNKALDITIDNIIKYYVDATGNTSIRRFPVSSDIPYPDLETAAYESVQMDEISPIWEAGNTLSQMSTDNRRIFTFIDKDSDKVIDESLIDDPLDDAGEVVRFHVDGMSAIKPYLGIKDNTAWSYLGATHDDRANNLIQFIRGNDSGFAGTTQIRSRTIGGVVNRLGDVVYSTPVSVSKPSENLDVIYSDESYQQYYNAYKNRETVIYVGANDGMLHAFTSWEYDKATKQFIKPTDHDPVSPTELLPDLNIGDELWAYIPQALLPHLKWLPSREYTHVYYVDLKPRVADVQVFFDANGSPIDDDHPGGWGTVLIGGLNTGGKTISVNDDFDYDGATADTERDFSSCYFAIDITKPREPKLLWEKTFNGLNLTTSYPTVFKVNDKWFAAFGSGPADYDGTSGNKGHIFVVDVLTGEPYKDGANDWLFETGENGAFMSAPVSFDKNLNYSVDGIYIGQAYGTSGAIYKVTIPWDGTDILDNYGMSGKGYYIDDPDYWTAHKLFSSPAPVTASPTISIDFKDNVWLYFGTGRYISEADKSTSQQQYFFGIKDPFFNKDRTANYLNYASTLTLTENSLFDADPYQVSLNKKVYVARVEEYDNFSSLINEAQSPSYNGWFKSLVVPDSGPSERVINKPVIFGGTVLSPAFTPNADICSFGGDSSIYAFYFETGTAFTKPAFKDGTETIPLDGGGTAEVILTRTGTGKGLASSVGVHVGKERGAKGFIQQSTGAVVEVEVTPALNIKSGLTSWIEK
ncbi:MAG: hypothetical protein JXA35_02235 [Deltaproteobacteria bacterium]|nr:hypothetical protein [Deltaproteobacteria bacterium]